MHTESGWTAVAGASPSSALHERASSSSSSSSSDTSLSLTVSSRSAPPAAASNRSVHRCAASPADAARAYPSYLASPALLPVPAAVSAAMNDPHTEAACMGATGAISPATPPDAASSLGLGGVHGTQAHSDSTLAKRVVATKPQLSGGSASSVATPASSASSSARSASPASSSSRRFIDDESASLLPVADTYGRGRHGNLGSGGGGEAGEEDEEEEDEQDDLSIENFMRRHPCILDRGSDWLDRHPWVHPVGVLCATLTGVAANSLAAHTLQLTLLHLSIAYAFVLLNLVLLGYACLRPPGRPPQCRDEAAVIQLLHEWPASSHHYGQHVSEWSRSWSYCHACANWRPARTHHCSKCKTCVLLMDHHCVWIGQCVGANNFRHFCAYVVSILSLSLYSLHICWRYARHPQVHLAVFGMQLVVSLCGASMGAYLCARCVRLVVRNETAVEGLKKEGWRREQQLARQQKQNDTRGTTTLDHMGEGERDGGSNQAPGHGQTNAGSAAVGSSRGNAPSTSAAPSSTARDAESGLLSSSSFGSAVSASVPAPAPLFFSPFQCACHASSFRVTYCQRFNYPSLQSSSTPIPPLPFYHDYDAQGSWGLNAFLFGEDLRRMEKLHRWVCDGATPVRPHGSHMRIPPRQKQASRAEDSERQQEQPQQATKWPAQLSPVIRPRDLVT